MRFKIIPPAPDSLDRLRAVHESVPIVPDAEESCCRRLIADADVPAQDEAKEWLTFCRALGLAEEGTRGYARVRDGWDPEMLPTRFRERVYAADETLTVLADADGPLSAEAVFEQLRDRIPAWERARSADPTATWRERVDRLLSWTVLFGLAERVEGGYQTG
ncbi:hypothetical protein [Halosegnis sp.]|uniref:hypothetical protein n=1 Tax=Halosegnis sp. TaxID=2864959 RepID=UPI0035D4F2CA